MKANWKRIGLWLIFLFVCLEVAVLIVWGWIDNYSNGSLRLSFFPLTCFPALGLTMIAFSLGSMLFENKDKTTKKMILTKTPLRLSLFGGGSDMPEFFCRYPGAVVSFTINKYIYVGVNEKFDGRTRVSYSKTEIVDTPAELEHDLVRETLGHFDMKGLEITSISDIPGEGSGLGSSSAFTVGLVTALMAYSGGNMNAHPAVSAQMAYGIERNACKHVVGKQDHYAAAYGGLNYLQFNPDGTVNAERIPLPQATRDFLEQNVMLFWTGRTRRAGEILETQARNFSSDENVFRHGVQLAGAATKARVFIEDGKLDELGPLLDWSWWHKKQLSNVTTGEVDLWHARAQLAGAEGGKLCGAGGGGFLLVIAKPEVQQVVETNLRLRRIFFKVEERGSHVVYKD